MFLGDFPFHHWVDDDQEYEDQWAGDGPRPVVCKFCGAELYWHKTPDRGWRLADENGAWHVCPKPKPKSELDFSRSL